VAGVAEVSVAGVSAESATRAAARAGAWAVCVSVMCAMMCVSVRRECQVSEENEV
jgi:hypothetical protein